MACKGVFAMFIRLMILSLFLSAGGCATFERHPVATGIAVAFIAGSIAASAEQREGREPARSIASGCHASMQCATH
jgi:hypothetical protein